MGTHTHIHTQLNEFGPKQKDVSVKPTSASLQRCLPLHVQLKDGERETGGGKEKHKKEECESEN